MASIDFILDIPLIFCGSAKRAISRAESESLVGHTEF